MKLKLQIGAIVISCMGILCSPSVVLAAWPERPVTIFVPAGAGGGTDATSRMLASRLKEKFGQPFNVVNQGQGGGVIGITSIVSAKPDGYSLGVIYNFAHYRPMGQGEFDVDDLTPIAQYNFDPAGFQVKAGRWDSLSAAVKDIKADPASYTVACGGGCGGSWPIAVATMLSESGVDMNKIRMIPGQGAAAALQDLAAGGVDVVPSSVQEAGALIQAGAVSSLAVFGSKRLSAFPDVPTLKEETGMELELGAWRGVVGPAGLPSEVKTKMENALKEITNSSDWQEEMTSRGFGIKWRSSSDFAAFMNNEETKVRKLIDASGMLAK